MPAIRLLTLGCPLRQLYAARFPTLYRWVIARHGVVSGPRAIDIGVETWANAFCSGDYVGRWLWSDAPNTGDPVGHPMLDGVHGHVLGRVDAYASFIPMPPDSAHLVGRRELELCIGLGAHTHYLEPTQEKVAWLVDYLLQECFAAEGRPIDGINAGANGSDGQAAKPLAAWGLLGGFVVGGFLAWLGRRR